MKLTISICPPLLATPILLTSVILIMRGWTQISLPNLLIVSFLFHGMVGGELLQSVDTPVVVEMVQIDNDESLQGFGGE